MTFLMPLRYWTTTTATLVTFLTSVFSHEGNPDNGSQSWSITFQDFLKDNGITHVYHAQVNGAVERFTEKSPHCSQTAAQLHKPWKQEVTAFLHIYRATPHATTKKTPFELMRGRQMHTKLHILPLQTTLDSVIRQYVKAKQKEKQGLHGCQM